MGDDRGFYVLNENLTYEFVPITGTPKHVKIPMSEAVSGRFNFEIIRHAIIQRVYDIDVPRTDESKIQLKIEEQQPYEEVVPEYIVKPNIETADESSAFSVAAIRKSKLDYIRGYLDSLDTAVLDEKHLDKEKLFEILKNYYDAVVKEQ